jgi:uncharacterized protein (UPF0276 family)
MRHALLPTRSVGIGLKPMHVAAITACTAPAPSFFEIHAENYLGDGGPPHRALAAVRRDHALSIHAVGLSLGSAHGIDETHLARLKRLVDRYEPMLVSDHLSWSAADGITVHDLLPLPYSEEALAVIEAHVARAQDFLQRPLLVENPSVYVQLRGSTLTEAEFMRALSLETGCRWLLDINNLYVSARNLGRDPMAALDAVDADLVDEIHLAGHARESHGGGELLIDDHGSPVCDDVWQLYARFVARHGARPTLIEWDTDVPPYETLASEAEKARAVIERSDVRHAA